ncbi:hypothetical protein BDR04DRAFT_1105441, partial [Suillus decipiens]
ILGLPFDDPVDQRHFIFFTVHNLVLIPSTWLITNTIVCVRCARGCKMSVTVSTPSRSGLTLRVQFSCY